MQNEQYPMPAMTEQEREDVITACRDTIKHAESYNELDVLMARVALAALTAKPVATRCRLHHCVNPWLYVPQETYSPDTTGRYQEQPVYTAPPVQVLRPVELPESQKKARIDYADDSYGYEG